MASSMRSDGRCPHCQGDEIYETGGRVELDPLERALFTTVHALGCRMLVCAGCGHIEWWTDSAGIESLRELAGKGRYAARYAPR
jgi:hypothetical protein